MKRFVALLLMVVMLLSCACAESAAGALQEMYAQAELLMVQGDYTGAAAKFDALGAYADASQMAMYCKAVAAAENLGMYSMAVDAFTDLGDFKDSRQMAQYYAGRAHEAAGTVAIATASDADLVQALWQLEEAQKVYGGLAFFKDSLTRYAACGEQMKEIQGEQSRRAQTEREKELARMEGVYQQALTLEQNGDYAGAIELYRSIHGYKDSEERIASCETAILDGKYDAAVALMEAGKYSEAIEAFKSIRNHKDSAEKIKVCMTVILYSAAIGTYITFGSYEQDNDTANGKEDIEWLVLAKEDNRLLVISRYALDCTSYDAHYTAGIWETCTLRNWLNKNFLNAAFSSMEQTMIPTVTVAADKNPAHGVDYGKATQEKVFLLSITEANNYFKTDSARRCKPTAYAKARFAETNSSGCCRWWLRTPGNELKSAAFTNYDGGVNGEGYLIVSGSIAVRPAMWIELAP